MSEEKIDDIMAAVGSNPIPPQVVSLLMGRIRTLDSIIDGCRHKLKECEEEYVAITTFLEGRNR